MDKNTIKNFRVDFAEAVKQLEEEYGAKIQSLNHHITTMTHTK